MILEKLSELGGSGITPLQGKGGKEAGLTVRMIPPSLGNSNIGGRRVNWSEAGCAKMPVRKNGRKGRD